jgi:cell division protein FtsB
MPNKRERSKSLSPKGNRSKILKMDDLKTDIGKLTVAVTTLTTKFNQNHLELTSQIEDLEKKITDKVGKMIDELKEENKVIKNRVTTLESKVNDLEQQANNNSLIITGLPLIELTAFNAFTHIMGFLKLKFAEDDCKRISKINYKDGKGCFIIVKLYDEKNKDKIMRMFRERIKSQSPLNVERVFNLEDVSPLRGKQIRVKTLLTQQNATLLRQAHTYRNNPFAFVWESDGKILVREKEGDKAIVVRSLEQLSALAANKT